MLKLFKLLQRRMNQIRYLLKSEDLSSVSALEDAVRKRYEHPDEKAFYIDQAEVGLLYYEIEVFQNILNKITSNKKALVVGCGTGRECFWLSSKFEKVVGWDFSTSMINLGKKLAVEKSITNTIFTDCPQTSDLEDKGPFDFIYCTFGLPAHIPEARRRSKFLRDLSSLLTDKGQLCFHADVETFGALDYRKWIGPLLKRRFVKSKIEYSEGDMLRSYLGSHTDIDLPVYFHYYPSPTDADREARNAGLVGEFVYGNSWVGGREVKGPS